MIRPQDYEWAEELAVKKLRSIGRIADNAPTYYTTLTSDIQHLLTQTVSPTALYLRTQPDLISILPTSKIPVFLFEVKSWKHPTGNLPIEAFPFGVSHILSNCNINILYLAVKDENEIRGEFVQKIKNPEEIRVPFERWADDERERLKRHINTLFPECKISDVPWRGGSGDPYFLIPKTEVEGWSLVENIETIKQLQIGE